MKYIYFKHIRSGTIDEISFNYNEEITQKNILTILLLDALYITSFCLLILGALSSNLVTYETKKAKIYDGAFSTCVDLKKLPPSKFLPCIHANNYPKHGSLWLSLAIYQEKSEEIYNFENGINNLINEVEKYVKSRNSKIILKILGAIYKPSINIYNSSLYLKNLIYSFNFCSPNEKNRKHGTSTLMNTLILAIIITCSKILIQFLNIFAIANYIEMILNFVASLTHLVAVTITALAISHNTKYVDSHIKFNSDFGFTLLWISNLLSWFCLVSNLRVINYSNIKLKFESLNCFN
ncbi:hypothetical protein HZS_5090 [Henneguya salminicola]|nr:hypothetical protein HZS_5090 [Henneguya salminicola]